MTQSSIASVPDTEWLEAAVSVANVPTLACILVQMTGDRRWIEGDYVPSRTRGLEDNDDGGLPESTQQEIKAAALKALTAWFHGRPLAIPNPSDELLLEMMSVTLGEQIPAEYAPIIRHELGLAAQPVPTAPPPGFSALIIGAGISGLCAAVQFEAAKIPYVIVERRENLGGVWFDNRYPGAACDVPSHLYSFSFAPYPWSRYFAGSREIHRYLEHVADEYDIRRHIRFGVDLIEARFDEGSGTWHADVRSADGQLETLHANIVISGVGAFNKPRIPDVPGLAAFKGPSVHTAQYPDAGLDLQGRNVVLVGNGASAMQVAPAIVDKVGSLTIVQRTPQWVAPFPKFEQPIPGPLQNLLQVVPMYRLWYRLRLSWAFNDKLYDALQQDPEWAGEGRSINAINDAHRRHLTAYIQSELGDHQELLPEVLPDYPPFGKRMLLDNGWFRALTREHVCHVNGTVIEVRPDSVITSDGAEHKADVIIWATGFDVVNLLAPMRIKGIGGRDIHEDWNGDDARAYLGTVVPGYPNLFCLYGPNTQFGHGGSLITVLERQMHYVMSLLEQMFARGIATVDVRQDVHDAYNAEVDRIHAHMIWTYPGVENYCQNSKGRIVVNNPFRIVEVWGMTETANLSDFICAPAAANPAIAGTGGLGR
ncbi:MAG: NAD(P)/FAD-dependent oxidoreductase [Pseudomonadota bacterium]